MKLRLFDTYTRSVRDFEPLDGNQVRMYACGLTVYDYAHIGNLRTYIFEDLLRRTLEFNGYPVNHVMNITDVGHLVSDSDSGEDKMEKSARRTGKSAWEIADFYTQAFIQDFDHLNIKMPTVLCKATDHIQEQIDFICCIEKNGFTYATSDGIYFDTSKLTDYGYLARLDIEGLQAGSRIELGEKKNPTDFALWKFSPKAQQRQMEWDSPWGKGFPGWHIECSAMSVKYLGDYFDIHCGGEDHIPVHHTNEIAQTEACYHSRLANFWMHGYFLQIDDSKMAKSTGGFIRVQSLIDNGYDPLAYRFYTLSALYRAKLNFTWDGLDSAAKSFDRLRSMVYQWGEPGVVDDGYVEQFREQINDDLNFPRALAVTWELARSSLSDSTKKATIMVFDQVLGLRLADWQPPEQVIPAEILELAAERSKMRQEKRWAEADALRDRINAAGFEIEDTPQGPRVKVR